MAAPKDGLFVTNYHLIDRLDVTKERSEEEESEEERRRRHLRMDHPEAGLYTAPCVR